MVRDKIETRVVRDKIETRLRDKRDTLRRQRDTVVRSDANTHLQRDWQTLTGWFVTSTRDTSDIDGDTV